MNLRKSCAVLAALAAFGLAGPLVALGQLANPGFEDPITYDGPPFVGSWEGFSGPPVSSAANSSAQPRSGAQHLELRIIGTDNTFAGAFQDVPNQVPGAQAVFSGWHLAAPPSGDPNDVFLFDVGVEIRIEWRDSVSNMEISRTPNLTPVPTGQYTEFSLSAIVPAGADTARVVYAIQSFGPELTNTGVAYVDDTSYIPEPSALLMMSLGGLALAACRRRS